MCGSSWWSQSAKCNLGMTRSNSHALPREFIYVTTTDPRVLVSAQSVGNPNSQVPLSLTYSFPQRRFSGCPQTLASHDLDQGNAECMKVASTRSNIKVGTHLKRNVSKVGYAVKLRACSVCCRYLAVASKVWYGYGLSRCGHATWHIATVGPLPFFSFLMLLSWRLVRICSVVWFLEHFCNCDMEWSEVSVIELIET